MWFYILHVHVQHAVDLVLKDIPYIYIYLHLQCVVVPKCKLKLI